MMVAPHNAVSPQSDEYTQVMQALLNALKRAGFQNPCRKVGFVKKQRMRKGLGYRARGLWTLVLTMTSWGKESGLLFI